MSNEERRSPGRPYDKHMRSRVMKLVRKGVRPTHIAKQLMISRNTVYRYMDQADKQNTPVPVPKKQGGYRHSKLRREHILKLSDSARKKPKSTLKELQHELKQDGVDVMES